MAEHTGTELEEIQIMKNTTLYVKDVNKIKKNITDMKELENIYKTCRFTSEVASRRFRSHIYSIIDEKVFGKDWVKTAEGVEVQILGQSVSVRTSRTLIDMVINNCSINDRVQAMFKLYELLEETEEVEETATTVEEKEVKYFDAFDEVMQDSAYKEKMNNKEYAVINIKSREFDTSNEYRVCEMVDSDTFRASGCMGTLNGAVIKKGAKRFNWAMTGFRTEAEARKWMFDYRQNREQEEEKDD